MEFWTLWSDPGRTEPKRHPFIMQVWERGYGLWGRGRFPRCIGMYIGSWEKWVFIWALVTNDIGSQILQLGSRLSDFSFVLNPCWANRANIINFVIWIKIFFGEKWLNSERVSLKCNLRETFKKPQCRLVTMSFNLRICKNLKQTPCRELNFAKVISLLWRNGDEPESTTAWMKSRLCYWRQKIKT